MGNPGRPRTRPHQLCTACGAVVKLRNRMTCSRECFRARMFALGMKRRAAVSGKGFTKECIREILKTIPNKSRVARLLGISRSRVYQILTTRFKCIQGTEP